MIAQNDGIDPTYNHLVPEKVQQMFSELSKIYETEWEKDKIKVVDLSLTINPPYTSKDVVGSTKKSVL